MKNKHILILLVVLCLFMFTGCNKNEKTKLIKGIDYKIIDDYSIGGCGNEKGYVIDTDNKSNIYTICMGLQYTGGYGLDVKEVNSSDNKTEIIVEEIIPPEGATVTQALERPKITIEFSKNQENIIIKNTKGELYNKLN